MPPRASSKVSPKTGRAGGLGCARCHHARSSGVRCHHRCRACRSHHVARSLGTHRRRMFMPVLPMLWADAPWWSTIIVGTPSERSPRQGGCQDGGRVVGEEESGGGRRGQRMRYKPRGTGGKPRATRCRRQQSERLGYKSWLGLEISIYILHPTIVMYKGSSNLED
jgi:hypothetical protein